MSEMLRHLMIFYKYGGKQLYYFNTYDGQGELDIDKLNESSNITVDDYEIEDQDCEAVQYKIRKRRNECIKCKSTEQAPRKSDVPRPKRRR